MSRVKPSFWLFLIYKSFPIKRMPLIFASSTFFLLDFVLLYRLSSPYSLQYLICLSLLIPFLVLAVVFWLRNEWKKFHELFVIFQNGSETIGEVKEIETFRGQVFIRFEYEYQHEKCRSAEVVFPRRKTKNITVGQKVILYIDQQKPTQAFIRNLYLNTF